MARERNESGQYVETVGPDDVLDVFDTVAGPVITSSDVADALDCTTEAARQKLARLVDDGTLGVRKTGRTKVYWETSDGSDATTAVDVTDALAGWEHGRSAAEREASRQIAEQSLEWLREYGRAAQKMDAPLDEWAEADPQGRKPDSLWETVVREAWAHAVEQGAVEKPHSRAYRWVGGDVHE